MANYEDIVEAIIKGDENLVIELTKTAVEEGGNPETIIYEGLVKGMDVVGEKWKNGEFFVPEVLIASRAMRSGMSIVSSQIKTEMNKKGVVVMGTVEGDIHDIGKNLVNTMLEAAGFRVIDLGSNIGAEVFVKAVQENDPDIVGISALLTTTMPNMKKVVEAIREIGPSGKVKVMVGGAPVSQKFASSIGADGYAENAALAVDKAKELLAN
jgi:5-methyltetrahydrofolate--homocysteine methyltransferase